MKFKINYIYKIIYKKVTQKDVKTLVSFFFIIRCLKLTYNIFQMFSYFLFHFYLS